jgi:hypothetical protein
MAGVADAFYLPTDDPSVFLATEHTVGPWEPGLQHAGPPSALLTRAMATLPSSIPGPSQLVRLTMEILGPIRTGEMTVRAEVVRPGKAVELLESELAAGGRTALRSRAWRIRTAEIGLPEGVGEVPAILAPIPADDSEFDAPGWQGGYLDAISWRYVHGHFRKPGPAAVWTRLNVALVAGEEPTPLERLMAVADSGNGISSMLPPDRWWFINTELTVHLHRMPVGEWICLSAQSTLDSQGIGLAESELFDEHGRVGRGAQALMVGPR